MRSAQTRRAQQSFIDVREPGKGKALLHVLADGRSTGHYRLSERQLDKVHRYTRAPTWTYNRSRCT